jgi:thiol-disulfide isomerase/thioredoxin
MFWATWCPACKTELPVLEQLRAKYPPEELDILAISVDDTEEIMAEYLKSRPTTVPVYLSKAEVGSEFGVKGVPALYVLDKNGQVAFIALARILLKCLTRSSDLWRGTRRWRCGCARRASPTSRACTSSS